MKLGVLQMIFKDSYWCKVLMTSGDVVFIFPDTMSKPFIDDMKSHS